MLPKPNRQLILVSMTALLLSACNNSTDSAPSRPHSAYQCAEGKRTAVGVGKTDKPYLYKIERDGKSSYILGTVHLGFSLSDLPREVTQVLESSPNLMGEYRFDANTIQQIRQMENLLYNDAAWEKLFPKAKVEMSTDNNLTELERDRMVCSGVAPYLARKFNPSEGMCSLFLFAPFYKGFLDVQVIEHGNNRAKPFTALDTDEILKEADRLDGKTGQRDSAKGSSCKPKDLLSMKPSELDELAGGLMRKYRSGEESAFTSNGEKGLNYRNEKWMPKLRNAFAQGGYFVTMGAAHLRGERGVLDMLNAEGYKITRWKKAGDVTVPGPAFSADSSFGLSGEEQEVLRLMESSLRK